MKATADSGNQEGGQHEMSEGMEVMAVCPVRDNGGRQEQMSEQLDAQERGEQARQDIKGNNPSSVNEDSQGEAPMDNRLQRHIVRGEVGGLVCGRSRWPTLVTISSTTEQTQ